MTRDFRSLGKPITVVNEFSSEAEIKRVLQVLNDNKHKIHAWDTEQANMDPKIRNHRPMTDGYMIAASCYIDEAVDFGNGPHLFLDFYSLENGGSDVSQGASGMIVSRVRKDHSGIASRFVIDKFRPYFESSETKKLFHNFSHDYKVLHRAGIDLKGNKAEIVLCRSDKALQT